MVATVLFAPINSAAYIDAVRAPLNVKVSTGKK
jgi:hypothetical protein